MKKKQMSYELFIEMKKQQNLGISQRQVARNLDLTRGMLERWWHKSETEYLASDFNKGNSLEKYREFILSILKVYPQIRATNVFYKVKESFADFDCKRATFFRYYKQLTEESGFAKYKERIISPREQLPPGYEAQVDFGQFKLRDMYGQTVRVYFFCMVLSYSQMRFAYFSRNPFNTKTAIQAHEFAFKYFSGRTQTIMYDLDKVFVVNENYGDIVYAKEFEEYVRSVGFSTTMCRPRDPRTKGRVEALVGYVKYSFLEGRTYCEIDSLNSECLKWLDKEGNGTENCSTRKIPRELFREEIKYLIPTTPQLIKQQKIMSVNSKNSITYNLNEYALPKGVCYESDRIRVEESADFLLFYKAETNQFICRHKIAEGNGNVVTIDEDYVDRVAIDDLKRIFGDDERLTQFIERITPKRYKFSQCKQIHHLAKYYSDMQVINAIEYCLRINICSSTEIAAYLIYKYGVIKSRRCFSKEKIILYSKRAEKIREELNG